MSLSVQIALQVVHHAAVAGTYRLEDHIFAKKEPNGPWTELASREVAYTV